MNRPIRVIDGRFGRLILLEVGAPGTPHAHPEPTILLKHDGADTEYLIGNEPVPLTRGDIAFVNAQEIHADRRRPGSAPTRLLVLHASGQWLNESFPAVFGASGEQAFPRRREEITPRIRQLADTLAVEIVNDQFLSSERLEFMLQELVLSIIDTYVARRRTSSLWRGSRFEDSRIRRAIALLRAHPNKDLNMDDVASQVGLSRSRFYDLFQLCTGRSPRAYLDMLCVETAISRLAIGQAKIADVSAELGFSAQSNFTRFFLHQVGIPPSQYRRAVARLEQAPLQPPVLDDEPAAGR